MSICDIANKQNDGVFVCDNTIKTLVKGTVVGTAITYNLELQDGTIGTFTIDGSDITDITLTSVPNDSTPINFILQNIVELLNEQSDIDELTSLANQITVDIALIVAVIPEIETLSTIDTEIVTVANASTEVIAVSDDISKGIGTNQPTDSAILNCLTNASDALTSELAAGVHKDTAVSASISAESSSNIAAALANIDYSSFTVVDGELIVSYVDLANSVPSLVDGEFILTYA